MVIKGREKQMGRGRKKTNRRRWNDVKGNIIFTAVARRSKPSIWKKDQRDREVGAVTVNTRFVSPFSDHFKMATWEKGKKREEKELRSDDRTEVSE